jgi:putative hydrolase of the HAD superfamily
VITFDDTKVRKPNHKPFLYALNKLKLKSEGCVMVGDSLIRDIAPAKKLGFKTVFAKYGYIGRKFGGKSKVKADYVIKNIKELVGIV